MYIYQDHLRDRTRFYKLVLAARVIKCKTLVKHRILWIEAFLGSKYYFLSYSNAVKLRGKFPGKHLRGWKLNYDLPWEEQKLFSCSKKSHNTIDYGLCCEF
jgi:hypothetical protein